MKAHKYVINLDEDERQRLLVLVRSSRTSRQLADRARIILWADEGETIDESARRLTCHRVTVIYWRKRFLERRGSGVPTCLRNERVGVL